MNHPLPVLEVNALRRLYDGLPTIECKGLCSDYCCAVGMSSLEAKRIQRHTGVSPLKANPDFSCPVLSFGRCAAYPVRPLICRLWGVTVDMPCPHGCQPTRWLSKTESTELLHLVFAIGGGDVWPDYSAAHASAAAAGTEGGGA